jgi:hypothetical protein
MALRTSETNDESRPSAMAVIWAAGVAGLLAALVFTVFPEIDLWASGLFMEMTAPSHSPTQALGRISVTSSV